MGYFLFVGAWGDCFAACGHALRIKQETGESFGVLHYGMDPDISVFFREQNLFSEVKWLKPRSKAEYAELVNLSARSVNPKSVWLPYMLAGSGVKQEGVVCVHVHDIEQDHPVDRWHGAVVPNGPKLWADCFLKEAGVGSFYLINPISLQSTHENDHWPHWECAIRWLVECTEHTYVLVGQNHIYQHMQHPRLVNVSGYTDSMLEVLALADLSSGIITTCNGLSFWSILQQIPAVVAGHKIHARSRYFWNWLACEPNRMVEYEQGMNEFITLVQSMQDGG